MSSLFSAAPRAREIECKCGVCISGVCLQIHCISWGMFENTWYIRGSVRFGQFSIYRIENRTDQFFYKEKCLMLRNCVVRTKYEMICHSTIGHYLLPSLLMYGHPFPV